MLIKIIVYKIFTSVCILTLEMLSAIQNLITLVLGDLNVKVIRNFNFPLIFISYFFNAIKIVNDV